VSKEAMLFRVREKDTPHHVSQATIEKLMAHTGLSKTAVLHQALRDFADAYLPRLDENDPSVTPGEREAIVFSRRLSTDLQQKD
jgi:hypothetical protein